MSVHFYLRPSRKAPAEDGTVQIVLQWSRTRRLRLATPIHVAPRHWSAALVRVNPSAPGAVEINGELLRLRAVAGAEMASGRSTEEVKAALLNRFGKAPKVTRAGLLAAFDAWTEHKRPMLRPGTLQTYSALRKHLLSIYGKGAPVETVGGAFLSDLARQLSALGLATTTVNKLLKAARPFVESVGDAYGVVTRAKVKTLPTANNAPLFLTEDELARLSALDLSGEIRGYGAARDLFIAEATTGMRFGDIQAMTWAQIDRKTWTWHLSTQKTADAVHVSIKPRLRAVIEAREGEPTPLPALSNQKANKYLKEVCRLAGIDAPVTTQTLRGGERVTETRPKWKVITTHAARKTYVTLYSRGGGATTDLVGHTHSSHRTMQQSYVGRDAERREEVIDRVFGGLPLPPAL